MQSPDFKLDLNRQQRTGLDEAVFCGGKTSEQINNILEAVMQHEKSILLTHLTQTKLEGILENLKKQVDFDPISNTGFFSKPHPLSAEKNIAIISAGTSDVAVATEAARTLTFFGHRSELIHDVGVAGLWRLLERLDEIAQFPIIIVVAGMDGALPTVLGGLVNSAVIAVPTSVGYGAAEGGRTALNAALSSCTSGIVVVNIDNGYGAACAAIRILTAASRSK
jgi:hypothetical protein